MKLVPKEPPGRSTRKARGYAPDMRELRAQGYTFEAIRDALPGAPGLTMLAWAIAGAKAITDMFWWFFTFWLPDLFHKVFSLSQEQLVGPTALAFSLAALGALSGGSPRGCRTAPMRGPRL